jgi:glycosyltransferase involved in cell wall biosynthesis
MACGLPVVATNWSGPAAFIDETVGYPLAVDALVPVE